MSPSADAPQSEPEAALPTARFRAQHIDLFKLSATLSRYRTPQEVRAHAGELTMAMARFLGKLRVHAAMEEEGLYPTLLADPDPAVAAAAQQMLDAVGGVYKALDRWATRWRSKEALEAHPEGYLAETKDVLRQLTQRVTLETMLLYPLADARLGGGA